MGGLSGLHSLPQNSQKKWRRLHALAVIRPVRNARVTKMGRGPISSVTEWRRYMPLYRFHFAIRYSSRFLRLADLVHLKGSQMVGRV
jgi:hypothetical protein